MENILDFKSYLATKKIDAEKFNSKEPELYEEWRILFDQVHPDSFTAQKLFLINPIRRKYTLDSNTKDELEKPKKTAKPKFKRP